MKWPCAFVFALSGVAGAAAGAALGKMVDGQKLLFVFGLVMVAVALAMLRPGAPQGNSAVRIDSTIAMRLVVTGLVVGLISGFFGIGGGFLIVPAIMLGSGMATLNAVGSSLLSVGAFGLTTAVSYATAGLVDWHVAAFFVAGGVGGGLAGVFLARRLAARKSALTRVFAVVVLAVAAFVLWKASAALFG